MAKAEDPGRPTVRPGSLPTDDKLTLELVRSRLSVEHKQREGRPDTVLKFKLDLPIDHRRFLFSLAGYALGSNEQWDDDERSTINKLARENRGRVLFVIDRATREMLVAIGFSHREKTSHALLVYAFAIRREPELADASKVLARIAKQCLHLIAMAYGRPGHLLYDVRGGREVDATSFGFRPASQRNEDVDRVGGTLMRQEAPEA